MLKGNRRLQLNCPQAATRAKGANAQLLSAINETEGEGTRTHCNREELTAKLPRQDTTTKALKFL